MTNTYTRFIKTNIIDKDEYDKLEILGLGKSKSTRYY